MRQYKCLFKIRFINSLQYRVAAIAGCITQLCFGFMYILLYKAFYSSGNIPENFNMSQLVTFLWLQQITYAFFSVYSKNNDIVSQIEQGNICYNLVRPMDIYSNWFTTIFAERLAKLVTRGIPIILVIVFLPKGFGIGLPASFLAFVLFLTSLILGAILTVSISMLCYCIMFKTMSSNGVFTIATIIAQLFGGQLVPVPLLPEALQKTLNFMPFRYMTDLPFRTYTGSIDIKSASIQILIQLTWVIGTILLGKFLLKRNLKKVEIQGG